MPNRLSLRGKLGRVLRSRAPENGATIRSGEDRNPAHRPATARSKAKRDETIAREFMLDPAAD